MTDAFEFAQETLRIRPPKSEAQAVEVARSTLNVGCRRVGGEFTEPDDDWEQMFLVVERKIATLITGDAHKHAMAEAVGWFAHRRHALAIGHLASSWMVDFQGVDAADARRIQREVEAAGGSTEGLPNRIEILLLATYSASIARGYYARILRHEDQPPKLGLFERMPDHGVMQGAMVDPLRESLVKLG